MNPICERLAGTQRREMLDRVLILGEAQLRSVLVGYQAHYNTARPHQGIAQRVSAGERDPPPHDFDRRRHRANPPKTCPGRPDQRVHARRLTEDLQATYRVLFSSGTGVPTQPGKLTTEMACRRPLVIRAESVGWQQGEPFSFAQVPGCDNEEVAAVEGCDLADVEPFGEGDHAGVHHLQSQ